MTAKTRADKAPVTPDGRYFVIRNRLWRCSNPGLSPEDRSRLVHELMQARRDKGLAMKAGDSVAREAARQAVDAAKHSLGERGAAWWTDGSPDWNRHLVHNSPYAEWFAQLQHIQSAGK